MGKRQKVVCYRIERETEISLREEGKGKSIVRLPAPLPEVASCPQRMSAALRDWDKEINGGKEV